MPGIIGPSSFSCHLLSVFSQSRSFSIGQFIVRRFDENFIFRDLSKFFVFDFYKFIYIIISFNSLTFFFFRFRQASKKEYIYISISVSNKKRHFYLSLNVILWLFILFQQFIILRLFIFQIILLFISLPIIVVQSIHLFAISLFLFSLRLSCVHTTSTASRVNEMKISNLGIYRTYCSFSSNFASL